MLSFYKFSDISDPENFANELSMLWQPFKAAGRVYVAHEGINAQCGIPTTVLDNFKKACETLPIFSNGIYLNIDHELSRNDYEESPPFKAMHIRVRDQIVADGFDRPLDWEKSGKEMAPLDWHRELDNPNAIVLDCRNSYESEIGKIIWFPLYFNILLSCCIPNTGNTYPCIPNTRNTYPCILFTANMIF